MNARTPSALRRRPAARRASAGFTLIELLIAMVVSLALAGALIILQAQMGQQGVRTSDVASRDDQARSAMELVTRDLSGAGFLFGGTQMICNFLTTYNNGTYATHHAVDAVAAVTGATVPYATSITLNYPPATVPSDVLVVTTSDDATRFAESVTQLNNVAPGGGYTPLTTGLVRLVDTTTITGGDTAILQVPDVAPNARWGCLRVPASVVAAAGTAPATVQSNAGVLMPAGFYNSFNATMQTAGYVGPLSNGLIFQGRMLSIGTAANTRMFKTVYFIDNSGTYPVLRRNVYNLANDAIVETDAIAAGVVSLQVRFGVDVNNTGGVTVYENAAAVTANRHWDWVRSVQVWIVTRTLADDPSYTTPTLSITAPTNFTSVPVLAGFTKRRYTSQLTEIATRATWNSNSLTLPYTP